MLVQMVMSQLPPVYGAGELAKQEQLGLPADSRQRTAVKKTTAEKCRPANGVLVRSMKRYLHSLQ